MNFTPVCIDRQDFDLLFDALGNRGYTVVGPVVRDGAILYDEISAAAELPVGWGDEQEAGTYRLKRRSDAALFGYNMGPQSWKKYLFLPREKIWAAHKRAGGFEIETVREDVPRYAFIGVRACEIAAIRVQDEVFMGGGAHNPRYESRRKNAFIVAVNCGQAAKTCFCTSMNTGPKVTMGYDLALTEIIDADRHYFLVEAGTETGAEVLSALPNRPADGEDIRQAAARVENARKEMGRRLDTRDIKDMFYRNYDNKRWDDVAERCLSCGNCTLACPTCFCSTVEDVTDLSGDHAERWQTWDSCFTADFSYLHGAGAVRGSVKSRYRQWITHKLATWIDQFGSSGCVGCGRCIAWCPVGIDITEEARVIRASDKGGENNGE